jgi:hypothetical protein
MGCSPYPSALGSYFDWKNAVHGTLLNGFPAQIHKYRGILVTNSVNFVCAPIFAIGCAGFVAVPCFNALQQMYLSFGLCEPPL